MTPEDKAEAAWETDGGAVKQAQQFNVGDRVKLGFMGSEGVVVKVEANTYTVYILNIGQVNRGYEFDELELVRSALQAHQFK
jgi:hypothetical protein